MNLKRGLSKPRKLKTSLLKSISLTIFQLSDKFRSQGRAAIPFQYIISRNFVELLKNKLQNEELNGIKISNEVINVCAVFLKIIWSLYDKCFPKKKIKLKPKAQCRPCIMKGIRKSSKKKQRLYEKLLEKQRLKNEAEHREYRNLIEVTKRRSKKNYYSQKLIKYKSRTKKTWRIMKEVTGKTLNLNPVF